MKRFRDIFIGVLIGYILMTTTPVLADSIMQRIDVVMNSVQVQVNGEKLDANTILYDGSTYLQMRKVAEAVGKEVNWNGDTKIANIVEKKDGDKLSEVNNEAKIWQGDDGYFYAERDGELLYSWTYVSIELLNKKYDVDGSRYTENILRFYNNAESFDFECETIKDKLFISKSYYENTILPLIK